LRHIGVFNKLSGEQLWQKLWRLWTRTALK